MRSLQKKIQTAVGSMYLVASEKGLQGLLWQPSKEKPISNIDRNSPQARFLALAELQLDEYFNGLRKDFDIPLDTVGTPFQKKVWQQLAKIPYGRTESYKDIAVKIKSEKAFRAVGTANGKNPISIIIPCHRVIAHNGTLGGYAGGLDIKTKLLDFEKQVQNKSR